MPGAPEPPVLFPVEWQSEEAPGEEDGHQGEDQLGRGQPVTEDLQLLLRAGVQCQLSAVRPPARLLVLALEGFLLRHASLAVAIYTDQSTTTGAWRNSRSVKIKNFRPRACN